MPLHLFTPTSPSYRTPHGTALTCTRCHNEPGHPPSRSSSYFSGFPVSSSAVSTFSQATQATLKYVCTRAEEGCKTAVCEQCLQDLNGIFKRVKLERKTYGGGTGGGYHCRGELTRAEGWGVLGDERMKRREEAREAKGKGKEREGDEVGKVGPHVWGEEAPDPSDSEANTSKATRIVFSGRTRRRPLPVNATQVEGSRRGTSLFVHSGRTLGVGRW